MIRRAVAVLLTLVATGGAAERDASAILRRIERRHLPQRAILDPVFASANDERIVGYTRCGDSALWTGYFLAAESFRYRVSGSGTAFANARRTVLAIQDLIDVTGNDVLARCAVPAGWRYGKGVLQEESAHGVYAGTLRGHRQFWVGDTSRDQYSGVFFGLSTAYRLIDDQPFRLLVRNLIERMLDTLLLHNWTAPMPDNRTAAVFWGRPDQALALLQAGRQVNPEKYRDVYTNLWASNSAQIRGLISLETLELQASYFKFNLDYINLLILISLEDDVVRRGRYLEAYELLRSATRTHGNAFFNMIDHALRGPDRARDAETRLLLDAWLQRPVRDVWLDLRQKYPQCGTEDQACEPIPVGHRVQTDFLWQRSPFLLYGGGSGRIESAGVDYLLPYWMARFYDVIR